MLKCFFLIMSCFVISFSSIYYTTAFAQEGADGVCQTNSPDNFGSINRATAYTTAVTNKVFGITLDAAQAVVNTVQRNLDWENMRQGKGILHADKYFENYGDRPEVQIAIKNILKLATGKYGKCWNRVRTALEMNSKGVKSGNLLPKDSNENFPIIKNDKYAVEKASKAGPIILSRNNFINLMAKDEHGNPKFPRDDGKPWNPCNAPTGSVLISQWISDPNGEGHAEIVTDRAKSGKPIRTYASDHALPYPVTHNECNLKGGDFNITGIWVKLLK